MPKATKTKLAPANGRWIMKSDAVKQYKLAPSDLDSILPVSVQRNPRHYHMSVTTYNVRDVEALAQRIRNAPQASSSASVSTAKFAVPNGKQIMRTTAMNEFGLKPCQMDRIKPVKEMPNPHRSGTMRFYNRCDVQALATSIATAAAAPTAPAPQSTTYHDHDDDYNVFDGMSGEEAAFALAKWTGISGPAMAYCR
ncbi:hypothetical protein C8R47DRAFT_77429 [Mycena vitilis]|nr:hypothetical protein C8R47DRAFT_77429 [Mycena vitilis]